MGVTEEAGKVASSVVDVMKGAPLILALLLVNIAFIAIITYVLAQIATSTQERSKEHLALIGTMLKDLRECRVGGSNTKYIKHRLFRDVIHKPTPPPQ
jgi:hypothetical protein